MNQNHRVTVKYCWRCSLDSWNNRFFILLLKLIISVYDETTHRVHFQQGRREKRKFKKSSIYILDDAAFFMKRNDYRAALSLSSLLLPAPCIDEQLFIHLTPAQIHLASQLITENSDLTRTLYWEWFNTEIASWFLFVCSERPPSAQQGEI